MNFDNAEVFVALAVFGIGGVIAGAQLRGRVNREWRDRVDDTELALTDRAVQELRELQRAVINLSAEDQHLPGLATFDPASVVGQARSFQRTLEARSKVGRAFNLLLGLGWPLVGAGAAFLVGLTLVFCDSSDLLEGAVPRYGGAGLMIAGVGIGGLCGVLFVICSQRLSGAEVRAAEPVQDDDGAR